ncbi:MAG: DNA internalization-related competence protein ComEC/Rec2 [Kiritimatiellia bacterium]|nr:DNA internalization-related competence protein ComEC/Rec2 [Kiritimatiellia bacterium]
MEFWLDNEIPGGGYRLRPPRRRVMVGITMVLVAGTAAGIAASFSALWFLGAGASLLPLLFLWVHHRRSTLPLMVAVFCLVAAHARQSTSPRPALSLGAILAGPIEYVQFVAMATEDALPRSARRGQRASAVVHMRVEGLNRDGRWQRVEDTVRVILRGDPTQRRLPRYGERWRLRGVVRPRVPWRSGLFTLPKNQAIVDQDRFFFLDAGHGHPVKAASLAFRRRARQILSRGLDDFPEERGLLQALLLGYREELSTLLRQDFAVTGTVHIFAISGAHVGMVTMLLMLLLRSLRVPRTQWFWVATPLLITYTVATGAATSAVRACVMAVLLQAAPLFRRKPDAVSILAVAAAAILLAAPGQLGDLGFLLSFTAVASLLAIQPVFDAGALRLFRRDTWQLPREEQPEARHLREVGLLVSRFGSVSVAAWVGTSPLTAFFFNLVSPVALIMNLVVIPSAFVILLAGVLSLVSAPVCAEWSEIFNHAARVWAQGLAGLIRWAASVPGGHWFVRTPPVLGVVMWYGILALSTILARRIKRALPVGLAVLAVLAVGWGVQEAQRCRVSVLDVGEGNAVLVQAQAGRILIDSGPAFCAERTLRQLRAEGVNSLDVLILSHADAAHMGATPFLLSALPVGEVWVPSSVWPSPLMREVLHEAQVQAIPVRRLQAGDSGHWPGQLYWEVLWPPDSLKMARADDAALVMRVARWGVSVLLPSDLGTKHEAVLIRQAASLAASVLLAGRHGDADATSEPWLEAVRPRDVVVSSGPHLDSRHPDREVVARLDARGIRLWRTDEWGAIHIELGAGPARWPHAGYRVHAGR